MSSPLNPLAPTPSGPSSSPFPFPSLFPSSPFPTASPSQLPQPLSQTQPGSHPLHQTVTASQTTTGGPSPSALLSSLGLNLASLNTPAGTGSTPNLGNVPPPLVGHGNGPSPNFNFPLGSSTLSFLTPQAGSGLTPGQFALPLSLPVSTAPTGTPGFLLDPSAALGLAPLGLGAAGGGVGNGGVGGTVWRDDEATWQHMARLLARAEQVLTEAAALESTVFVKAEGAQRAPGPAGSAGLTRLEALHLEYSQILVTLIPLASSDIIGALPVPLSLASSRPAPTSSDVPVGDVQMADAATAPPAPEGTESATGNATENGTIAGTGAGAIAAVPTQIELADWAEKRAAAEFTRREAVKEASRSAMGLLKR